MENNCSAYIKVETQGKMIVYWRCLEDSVKTTGLCAGHLAKKIVEENDNIVTYKSHGNLIQHYASMRLSQRDRG